MTRTAPHRVENADWTVRIDDVALGNGQLQTIPASRTSTIGLMCVCSTLFAAVGLRRGMRPV